MKTIALDIYVSEYSVFLLIFLETVFSFYKTVTLPTPLLRIQKLWLNLGIISRFIFQQV